MKALFYIKTYSKKLNADITLSWYYIHLLCGRNTGHTTE
jgi:hypothetical protein